MFTDGRREVDKIEFAYAMHSNRPSIIEWKRRLGLKYDASVERQNRVPDEEGRLEYTKTKMARSVHDLALSPVRYTSRRISMLLPTEKIK